MAYATDSDVSDRLGRPLSTEEQIQVLAWLRDVEARIEARFTKAGLSLTEQVALGAPSADTLVRVESEVVIRRLYQPKPGRTSVTRAIDDGSLTERWDGSGGSGWSITDDEWLDLLPRSERGAFTIRPGLG